MASDPKAGKLWRPLAADIRQAIVGWVVVLALPLAGALALTALVGDVPAWVVALVLAVTALVVAAISIEHRRELGRVEGALGVERKRREDVEDELAQLRQDLGGELAPAGGAQQGLLFRIKALRGELEIRGQSTYETTPSQDRALANLAVDIREDVGQSAALDDIVGQWRSPSVDASVDDAMTALGQLEGMVISGRRHH